MTADLSRLVTPWKSRIDKYRDEHSPYSEGHKDALCKCIVDMLILKPSAMED